ncbi:hypothetical protein [Tautonia plasticadhaerens]|uniref:Cytochrome C n=1 Tax=Tautonia plasticadhaerens TaxID=2527974 RepID=A0A518GWY5_9BACT|nr:hypothetical protein [Tautonia plasticadhaerens]QDV33093.1 hypothetical protein ElP_09350 [Tautonia plasticadhaerens]
MRWTRIRAGLLGACCLAVVGIGSSGDAVEARHQDEPPGDRALGLFMQAKLDHAKDVLEGLTTGDFTRVVRGAQALRELTEDELWRVNPNINYVRYTEEFARLADALEAEGQSQDIDGATLNFVNLTINCVNCHTFVRDERVTLVDPDALIR